LEDGNITKVNPSSGVLGSRVTITGTNLLAGGIELATVELDSVEAKITAQSDTEIEIIAQNAAKGDPASVVITADTGATITLTEGWTYLEPGNVTSLTPAEGQVGTVVVIEGTSLFAGGSSIENVTLNGVEVTSISDTQSAQKIEVVVAAGDKTQGTTDIVMISDIGTKITGSDQWTYLEEGVVTKVTPNSGLAGTVVEIEGERLQGGGDEVVSVTVGGEDVTAIKSESDTSVTVVIPGSDATDPVDIVLTSESGAVVTASEAFSYINTNITDVSPAKGQVGVRVTITGNNMLAGGEEFVSVSFAGVNATIVSESNTEIVVRAVESDAKTGDIVLTSDSGAVFVLEDGFTYQTASEIDSVTPNEGQEGTAVTIEGSNLLGKGAGDDEEIVSAKLGDAEATVEFSNGTYILLTATNSSGGDFDVTLEATSGATTVLADGFTYLPLGSVTEVEPATGQVGTFVTISGNRLLAGGASAKTVTLAGVDAFIKSSSETSIQVRVTASDDTNTGDVVITSTTGAVVTSEDAFTYVTASDITKVEPANGQVGTVVVITGTNLRGNGTEVETVTLAGVEATIGEESDTEKGLRLDGIRIRIQVEE
jgi:hypothetical protein